MPGSSRHKSHRYHKRSNRDATGRSDSEDDGSSRGLKLRLVEAGPGSGVRASSDVKVEKRKTSSLLQVSLVKDKGGSDNADLSGRKRKEREEDSAKPDRWNGIGKHDGLPEKGSKDEAFGHVDSEKMDRPRILTVESKSRSSRRREGSTERYVESGKRTESVKMRSEKEHTRREYREDKERDKDGRVSERSKKVLDSRHGRSDDAESKSQRSRRAVVEVGWKAKKDSTESQARDDSHNAELDIDTEKSMAKRRCNPGGIDKGLDDGRNSVDRRLTSRDDHTKNGSHKVESLKDERYKDDRYRDKYYKGFDRDQRDQRHHDIKRGEKRSSRDYIIDRLESESVRDRDKHFDSYKKSRLHGSDHEHSPHADDRVIKTRGNRLRKRSYDDIDDHYDYRKISKASRSSVDKDVSNSNKFDYGHQGKVDSSLNNTFSRNSLSPKARNSKEQIRRGLKQAEYTHGEPACDDRACLTEHHDRISIRHEKESLSSVKAKCRDRVSSDDRERQLVSENSTMDSNSQADLQISKRASASPSLFKPNNHFSGSSPAHLFPQPPMKRKMNGPSAYDDGMRVRSGDRRSNSWHRRNCDQNMERGQGGAWKNGPIWPGPLANGFIPFPHGPPAPGFSMQEFSPLSLFGARPYMEMNRPCVPYHMHGIADQFSYQFHPFAWHHPVDVSCSSQMNGWDGVNSHFGDKSEVFRGSDWNWNKHLIGGQELNAEMSKGPSSSMAEFSSPPELINGSKVAYPSLESSSKVENFQHALNAAAQVKQLNNPPDNKTMESCAETKPKWAPRFQKKLDGDRLNLFDYLSKIEISEDLSHPELYKEVKDILAPVNSTGIYNVSKNEEAKNSGIQNCRKGSSLKSSLVPAATDAFKRAMSVYEKQSFRRPPKPPSVAVCSNEVNVSLEATVEDGMKLASSSVSKEPLTVNKDNAASLAVDEDHQSITGDADDSLVHMEVEHVENPDDNLEDINPDVDILRTMSVYENQRFRRPSKPPSVAVCSNEVSVSLEATVEDGMKLASSSVPKEPLTVNNDNAASLVVDEDHESITGHADDLLVHMEVEHVENSDDNLKKQSDINPDVDILVSSRTCEAIMSVCKVNLIRIHNSPESTH